MPPLPTTICQATRKSFVYPINARTASPREGKMRGHIGTPTVPGKQTHLVVHCCMPWNYPQLAATQCSPTCTRHMNPCRQLCSSCLTGWKRSTRLPQRFCVLHMRKSIKASWMKPSKNRSEEHTSELQSLMRISYAVFCLKKKK